MCCEDLLNIELLIFYRLIYIYLNNTPKTNTFHDVFLYNVYTFKPYNLKINSLKKINRKVTLFC